MFGKKKEQESPNVITPIVEVVPQATLNINESIQGIQPQQGTNLNININTGNNSSDSQDNKKNRNTAKLILAVGLT